MGLTKTEAFTDQQNELANLAKALGHPARIAILEHLIKVNACVCGDLVEELPLAQATVSQHLRELKTMGLIKGSIEGTSVCYCIDTSRWQKVRDQFLALLNSCCSPGTTCC
ncbi:MAG: winged helix-turn-helix transcriptional regulator [Saprospiraceae bacterium]|jgi:ArsR family transcriptional regulator|nr:winged helix-turn-helix transcriptional regulator [Saprospiraceae bacterium]